MGQWYRSVLMLGCVGWCVASPAADIAPVPVKYEDEDITYLTLNPPPREPRFRIGFETRLTSGSDNWKISFSEEDPSFGAIHGRSKLDWRELNSTLYAGYADFRVNSWLAFSGSYGWGDITKGKGTDTDWLGLTDGPEFLLYQSISDTRGKVKQFNLDALIRVNEIMSMNHDLGIWDIVAGYQYAKEEVRDRNGIVTVDFTEPVHNPFEGLDSMYRFEWKALRFGLRGDYPVTDRLHVRLATILLFGVDYRGAGNWNLREDFLQGQSNFRHKASDGYGSDVRMSVLYHVTPNFFVEGGYGWFRVRSKEGVDTTYFADGTTGEARLDEARTERHGFFAGLGATF